MPRLCWSGLLLLGIALQVSAEPEKTPLYREIKDWVVACDNVRACEAVNAPDDGMGNPLIVHVRRGAGPDGLLRVRLEYSTEGPQPPLLLDGKPMSESLMKGIQAKTEENYQTRFAEGDAAVALLQAWRDGQSIQLKGDDDSHVSLDGLGDALALMDSVQGRLDTVTALIKPGSRPATDVPAAAPLPTITPFPGAKPLDEDERAKIVQAVMADPDPSDEGSADDGSQPPAGAAFALNDQEALVVVSSECAAYNCDYTLYRVSRSDPSKQADLQLQALPGTDASVSGSVNFDEHTGRLSYLDKGRGVGDCGETASWIFDGSKFQLADFSTMGRCSGIAPGDWPAQWSSDSAGDH